MDDNHEERTQRTDVLQDRGDLAEIVVLHNWRVSP